MEQTTGMTLRELLKKLYVSDITLHWDTDAEDDDPIARIYTLTDNDWTLSEELLDSEVFGIEVHNDELCILLRN